MKILILGSALLISLIVGSIFFSKKGVSMTISSTIKAEQPSDYPTAYLAGGCFWCLESQLRALEGVLYTRAGYQGGEVQHPTYEQVSTGRTGHTEVVEVTYDPQTISYDALLSFYLTQGHDATQINRQGVDVGTQYRSAIFFKDESERKVAEDVITRINNSDYYGSKPIATILYALEDHPFWVAEDYHQQYYEKYEESQGKPHIRVKLKEKRKAF